MAGSEIWRVKMKDRCPICNKRRRGLGRNRFFPFCSGDCKQVDLQNWMSESYKISEILPQQDDEEILEEDYDSFWNN